MDPRLAVSLTLVAVAAGSTLRCQEIGPHLAGQLRLQRQSAGWLERIHEQTDGSAVLSLLGAAPWHPVHRGDEVQVQDPATGQMIGTATVVAGTRADALSGRLHVRVRFAEETMIARLVALAPSSHRDYPRDARERGAFVRARAARALLVAHFESANGDLLADFVGISTRREGKAIVSPDAVPPDCSFMLRFNEPVDVGTLSRVQMVTAATDGTTQVVVPMRAYAIDQTNTAFRFEAPLGLPLTPAMREAAIVDPESHPAQRRPHFYLRIAAGAGGLRSTSGKQLPTDLELPITIDPNAEDNLVGWRNFPAPDGR